MAAKGKFLGMWVSEDKNGNPYLSGNDKETNTRYFVFSNRDNSEIKELSRSVDGGSITLIGQLTKRTSEHGEFLSCGDFVVAEHRFYDAADPYLKKKDGSYVTKRNGDKVPHPEYQLRIKL